MSRKDSDPWVRTFSVTDPIRHKKGYTLYKVTSRVFPKNSIEAVTQVTVWKRYNDFKKLHKALHALHQGLYLKGTFPPFAKARFFGRFDDQVVEERRKCALELLEFAAKYPPLFTSQVFVKFFESGQIVENPPLHENEECLDPVLKPTSLKTATSPNASFQKDEKENGNTLGGIWRHRQPADEISISSQNATDVEDEEDDRTTFTDDDPPAGKLSFDLSEFDPILENSVLEGTPKSSKSGTLCNEWLISAFQSCNVDTCERKDSDEVLVFPTPFGNVEELEPKPTPVENPSPTFNGDLPDCDIPPISMKDFDPCHSSPIKSQPPSEEDASSGCDGKALPSRTSESSYIFHSAKLVSAAQNAEMVGNVFEAFTLYKTAVDTLLQGVKDDKCPEQCEVVRRKVLQYLKRAEELYEEYLIKGKQNDTSHSYNRNLSSSTTSGKVVDLQLRKPITDLGKYRVIGILPGVILVTNTVSNTTCVVKVLRKSPSPQKPDMPNIAPRSISFMVDLYEVYETTDAIFLILEYASGGRLWDYLSSYLQQSPARVSNDQESIHLECMRKSSSTNVYSAKKLEAKKPIYPFVTKNTAEPTVTIGTAESDDPDLTPANECPPSYIALFKNYLVNTVSKKDAGLAQCKIDESNSKGIEISLDNNKSSNSFSANDISDLQYIDEVESHSNEKRDLSSISGDKDDNIQHDHSVDNADLFIYYRTVMDKINSSSNGHLKRDFIPNTQCFDQENDDSDQKSAISQEAGTPKMSGGSPKLSKNNKNLRVFFRKGLDYADSAKGRKMGAIFASEDEKSNTLVHASSTGTLECNTSGQPGLTEMFEGMYTEVLTARPGPLPETSIAQWGAEIVSVLDALHKLGIIWQDLNPENILLGSKGHILLTYQCQWNCVDRVLNEDAKRNLYAAPEVGRVFPVWPTCDWWSLGAILFELLTGKKLVSCHPSGITSHTTLSFPDFLSPEAEDILKQLLRYNESERLGSGPHGVEDIKYHPFFHSVDWNMLDAC